MELALYAILALGIGVWMYDDAKQRKLDQPSTLFFVGLLLSVLGLVSYWYWHIRPTKKVKKR